MKKHIYIIWLQGWKKSITPSLVWECARSWIHRNPEWEVHLISNENLKHYISEDYIREIEDVTPIQAKSDLIRFRLLYENPGLYVDAAMFCLKPLDTWFNSTMPVDDCFWPTIDQNLRATAPENYKLFDTNILPCITFLYSGRTGNPIFDASNFDSRMYGEGWKEYSKKLPHDDAVISYFRFWNEFVLHIPKDLILKVADNWPYVWRKNKAVISYEIFNCQDIKDYDGPLPGAVYTLAAPITQSAPVDEKFYQDLLMKWWPYYKLSLKKPSDFANNEFAPKLRTEKEVAVNTKPLEQLFPADSRIILLKKLLDREIQAKDGLTR